MYHLFCLTKRFMVIVILCCLLVGCNKLTQENFDKIKPGMKMKEVTSILGEPTRSDSINIVGVSGTAAVWRNKEIEITIQFVNGGVLLKSMANVDEQR